MKKRNFLMEALLTIPNLIFVAAGSLVTLTALAINPTLGFVAGGGFLATEAAVLFLLGNSKRFQGKVLYDKGWGGGLVSKIDRAKQASGLSEKNASEYRKIRTKYRGVSKRARDEFATNPMISAAVQKLETLSDSYLKTLLSKQRLESFIAKADPQKLKQQLEQTISKGKAAQGAGAEAFSQNVEMIKKRIEQVEKAKTNLSLFNAQLQKIELGVDLAYDNMISMDGATEVGSQIDLMLANLKDAEKGISEMDSLVKAEPIDDTIPQILQNRVR